jgi:chorismate dehydratase
MNEATGMKVRLGVVDFLSSVPIVQRLKILGLDDKVELVLDSPVHLNRDIREGELDISFISTVEYGRRPELYSILSGLSISALGPAGSVFLFSHVPMNQLDEEAVLATSRSETSFCLGKLILEEINKVHPDYFVGDVLDKQDEYKAVLASGDEALMLLEEARFLYQYDLGDMWKRETGLPFVFSLCAVREEFCRAHPGLVSEVHKGLLKCREEAGDDLEPLCEKAAKRIPFSKTRCKEYLQAVAYDLKADKRKSVEIFFDCLARRGEITGLEEPLRIFANLEEIL